MTIRETLSACFDSDQFVCVIRYRDERNRTTLRAVSPIRFLPCGEIINALCLGREEPRNFRLDRIESAYKIPSHEIQMPVEVQSV